MRKAIYDGEWRKERGLAPDPHTIGYVQDYMWKSVKYFVGPKEKGRYLVIDRNGQIREMFFTGTHNVDNHHLFEIAASPMYGDPYIDDELMTDSDILDLYRSPYNCWYRFVEWFDSDSYSDHRDLHVYTSKSPEYPLYFLDLNLDHEIELDENGDIVTDGEPQYYSIKNGEYVRKEKDSDDGECQGF